MNSRASIINRNKETGQTDLHLRSIITALEDIVFELDGNQVFKKVWAKDESMLFMPVKEFLGKSVYDVMGDMAGLFGSVIDESIQTAEPREVTYQHIDPSINKWYKLRIKPVVITEQPEDCLLILIIEDITEMKENELALLDAKMKAEKELKYKSEFLSVMSHEIRTPLNGIIGIANLLKLNHTEEQTAYIKSLLFSAEHLLELVNNILDYTKIENDKLELQYTQVDLFELATNITSQFEAVAEEKGLQLHCSIDTNIPIVKADPLRLAQMLNNLINNAIKFTSHGSIDVNVKLIKQHEHTVTVHFSVKDTGMGIPDSLKDTIFESFSQGERAEHNTQSGTGLGLTITQKLAALHHSQVFLISRHEKGAEFYFDITFDIIQQEAAAMLNSAGMDSVTNNSDNEHAKTLNGLRVIVVDDNPINTMVACKQLIHYGAVADSAHSGEQALDLLNKGYDAALIDLHMPDMDGYQLSKKIREIDPKLYIVIFTADIMADIKVKLAKIDVYDILSKPFNPEKLFDILNKVAQK